MCGFVVTVAREAAIGMQGRLARATDLIAHRGPDDCGEFIDGAVGMGFRRLSILDLSETGHQPMMSPDGRYVLVFNGEIFNYRELRDDLAARGHTFRSSGDTEVLLHAYIEWGRACLHRFNGMWAFLVYDRQRRTLFGARDRFGIKPLFWRDDAQGLMFASEIKAIRDTVPGSVGANRDVLATFLLDGVLDYDEQTFYAGIRQIPAGACFDVDANGALTIGRYWSLPAAAAAVDMPADPAAAFAELFDDAVGLTLRSDVPVGVLLSGGLDSTSILCSVARQRADSTGLAALCYKDPGFDESPLIDATLRQTSATGIVLDTDPTRLWQLIERVIGCQDEPVHSFNAVVGYQLMALARSRGIEVVLNGQGADETLAGYGSYFRSQWITLLRAGRLGDLARSIAEVTRDTPRGATRAWTGLAQWGLARALSVTPAYRSLALLRRRRRAARTSLAATDLVRDWTPRAYPAEEGLDQALQFSVERSHLPVYLRVEDRNAMAHGVEQRLPFLDHRLVALAFRLDADWKLRGRQTKVVLREAMRGRIPESVRSRQDKFGFSISVDGWFRGPLHGVLKDALASRVIRESGVWNIAAVEQALERHRRGEINIGTDLFDVVQVSHWLTLATQSRSPRAVAEPRPSNLQPGPLRQRVAAR